MFGMVWVVLVVVMGCWGVELPPKGWNSWDSFQGDLTEEALMQTASVVQRYLLPFGYDSVTIDEFWYPNNCGDATSVDDHGRPQPDTTKWPSSAGGKGFGPVADKIHAMGLKLGIHTLRGSISIGAVQKKSPILNGGGATVDQLQTTQCPWNKNWFGVNTSHPAAQAWLDSVYGQYAEWGVDFIKNDCIFSQNYLGDGIEAVSAALERTKRPFTYSLSPGSVNVQNELQQAKTVHSYVNMYRVTPDWHGGDMTYHFTIANAMAPFFGVEGFHGKSFPDLDMLNPYSNAHSDLDFKKQMTLWSIARSPLIYGADIREKTADDFALMTNEEILRVNEYTEHNQQVYRNPDAIAWTAINGTTRYVALFNLKPENADVEVTYQQLNLTAVTECQVRDLWAKKDVGVSRDKVNMTLPGRNGAAMLSLSQCH